MEIQANPSRKSIEILFKIVLGILLICFIAYEIDPNARMDDDYIGEQVYWLLKKGYVKSELMRDYNALKLENHQTVFHKLWVYNGFLFCSIAGWSIFSLHLSSLFYLFLFAAFFYYHIKKYYAPNKKILLGLSAFFILSNFEIKNMAWSFRPEVMVMCLGFISYHFLFVYLKEPKKINLILAGLIGGMAFLTHLNGLIYLAAGFGLLLLHKKYIDGLVFGLLAAVVFSFYFLDIFLYADIPFFIKQIQNDAALKKGLWKITSIIDRVLMEQARYLFSPKEIPFTIFLALIVPFTFRYLKEKHRDLLIYTLLLVVTMSFWCYTKVPYLLILNLPFLSLVGAVGLCHIYAQLPKFPVWLKASLIIILAVHFFINTTFSVEKIYNNYLSWQNPSTEKQNVIIRNELTANDKNHSPKNLRVLAFGNFIFNEIENFKSIKNLMQYEFIVESHDKPRMDFAQLVDSSQKYKDDYIIFNKAYADYFDVKNKCKTLPDKVVLVKETNEYKILKIKY